jgi:L-ascorbate metabolism protein UlaG (beta-lactamase superfamily)
MILGMIPAHNTHANQETHMNVAWKTPLLALTTAAALLAGNARATGETELTWYGHSAYKLTTPSGKVLLIDPWIANPSNKTRAKDDLEQLGKVDLILLTHGHGDHIGNSVEIGRKTGAKLVATFDLSKAMVAYKGYPKDQAGMATAGSYGGTLRLFDDEVAITFVTAVHGSDLEGGEGTALAGLPAPAGDAGGFVIRVKNGPTVYHAGDTDVFGDMALIGKFNPVDVFIAPIGDKFTMGPERAAHATRLVNPKKMVIPMHYGTFPALTGTPAAFDLALKAEQVGVPMREMKVGETLRF